MTSYELNFIDLVDCCEFFFFFKFSLSAEFFLKPELVEPDVY